MWILQAFHRLIRLEMLVLYASLILPQSLNSPDLLVMGQAGAHGIVWQEEHHQSANDDRDKTHQ